MSKPLRSRHELAVNFHLQKKRRFRRVVFWIVGILIAFLAYVQAPARGLYRAANEGRDHFESAKESAMNQDFSAAAQQSSAALQNFQKAQSQFRLLSFLRFFPLLGRQVSAIGNIVTVGERSATAATTLFSTAASITAPVQHDSTTIASITKEEKHQILQGIDQSQNSLKDALVQFDEAVDALNAVPTHWLLPPLQSAAQLLRDQLPPLQQQLHVLLPFLGIAPRFFGYPNEQQYLFLLQNNNELRPTGGFIGTYGILKLEDGEIDSFVTDNIYNLDSNAVENVTERAPEPLQKYIGATKWFLRDGNWSPDFPTAAQQVLDMYDTEKGRAQNLDGVIAVTPTVLEELLKVTGPLTVGGTTFSADNVVDYLQYQVEVGYAEQGISQEERKNIIGDLSNELFHKLLTLPKERWGELGSALGGTLNQKQFLFFLKNADAQAVVEQEGWSGNIARTSNDFALIVDANMASLKTDQHIVRQISYSIQEKDGTLQATLSMHYDNTGGFDWKSTRYRTYVRTYVPRGSELLSSEGFLENDKLHGGKPGTVTTGEEFQKTVFSAFTSIEPGEEGTTTLVYKLPDSIYQAYKRGFYSLLVQKQPGTRGHALHLDIPTLGHVQSYTHLEGVSVDGNRVKMDSSLLTDQALTLTFRT